MSPRAPTGGRGDRHPAPGAGGQGEALRRAEAEAGPLGPGGPEAEPDPQLARRAGLSRVGARSAGAGQGPRGPSVFDPAACCCAPGAQGLRVRRRQLGTASRPSGRGRGCVSGSGFERSLTRSWMRPALPRSPVAQQLLEWTEALRSVMWSRPRAPRTWWDSALRPRATDPTSSAVGAGSAGPPPPNTPGLRRKAGSCYFVSLTCEKSVSMKSQVFESRGVTVTEVLGATGWSPPALHSPVFLRALLT